MWRLLYFLPALLMCAWPSINMGSGVPAAGGGTPLDTGSIRLGTSADRALADCSGNNSNCVGLVIDNDLDWTIEFVVNCDTSTSAWRGLFMLENGTSNTGGFYLEDDASNPIMAYNGGNWNTWGTSGSEYFCDGNPHHVAITHDDADNFLGTLYVDGTSLGLGTGNWGTTDPNMDTWGLGPAQGSDNDIPFADISEVRVWDVERTATEIANHDACQLDPSALPANLVAYWPINDDTSGTTTTGTELVGGTQGADFVLSGGAAWTNVFSSYFTNDGSNDCYDDGS